MRLMGHWGELRFVALLVLCSCSKSEPPPSSGRAEIQAGGITWVVLGGTWSKDGDALVGSGGRVESKSNVADGTFELDVEKTVAAREPGVVGIGFRYSLHADDPERANGYLLNLKGTTFTVVRGANSYWQPVQPEVRGFQPSGLLDPSKNHVSVKMTGSSFRLDVHGDSLLGFEDTTYPHGRVGLAVESPAETVRFSGFHASH
jgi:hypothetical protein